MDLHFHEWSSRGIGRASLPDGGKTVQSRRGLMLQEKEDMQMPKHLEGLVIGNSNKVKKR